MITSLFTIQNCMACTSANIEAICLFAWQTKGTPQDTLLPLPVRLILTSLTNPTQLSHLAFHLSWLDFCHEVRHVEHPLPTNLTPTPIPNNNRICAIAYQSFLGKVLALKLLFCTIIASLQFVHFTFASLSNPSTPKISPK